MGLFKIDEQVEDSWTYLFNSRSDRGYHMATKVSFVDSINIESVDSVRRDSSDAIHDSYRNGNMFQNLKRSKHMLKLLRQCTIHPQVFPRPTRFLAAQKARKSTEPESCQKAKIVFLLLLSSNGLVQNCETLS